MRSRPLLITHRCGLLLALALLSACGDPEPTPSGTNNATATNNTTGGTTAPECTTDAACDDGDACTQDRCDEGVCAHLAAADGAACDDGDLCTQSDTCQAGACVGASPVVCVAADSCRTAGVCDPATGLCDSPLVADGTPCDDGDRCTQRDTCQAGVCTGADPMSCEAGDQCRAASVCDPSTGLCGERAPLPDNTPCDDGALCTQRDTCQAGACVGADPVVCVAPSCFAPGTCQEADGMCSERAPLPDGASCETTGYCEATVCRFTLAAQDFELVSHPLSWAYTSAEVLDFAEGASAANNAPPNSPLGVNSSRAWNSSGTSAAITLDPVAIPAGRRARLELKIAAMSLASSAGGPDDLDYVLVEVSTDGGATFHKRVRVRGAVNNNSHWSYMAAGAAIVDYLPISEETFQPTQSGAQEIEGVSTVQIRFPDTVTQVAARITTRASSFSDTWLIDDIKLTAE